MRHAYGTAACAVLAGMMYFGQISQVSTTIPMVKTFGPTQMLLNTDYEWAGYPHLLEAGATLASGTPVVLNAEAGVGKLRVEIMAAVDMDGTIVLHGGYVQRDTVGSGIDSTETITITPGDSVYQGSWWIKESSTDSMYITTTNTNMTVNVNQVSFDQYDWTGSSEPFLIKRIGVTIKTQDVPQARNFHLHAYKITSGGDTTNLLAPNAQMLFAADSLNRNSLNRLDRNIADSLQFIDGSAGDGIMIWASGTRLQYVRGYVYGEVYRRY